MASSFGSATSSLERSKSKSALLFIEIGIIVKLHCRLLTSAMKEMTQSVGMGCRDNADTRDN